MEKLRRIWEYLKEIPISVFLNYICLPYFFWTLVHELAHALTGICCGLKVAAFQPYPHQRKDGEWQLGSVNFTERKTPDIVFVAPYYIDLIATVILCGLAILIGPWYGLIPWVLTYFPLTDLWNGLSNWACAEMKSDLRRVSRRTFNILFCLTIPTVAAIIPIPGILLIIYMLS